MADPLSLIRQCTIGGNEVQEKHGFFIFGDRCWPKGTKTNYMAPVGHDGIKKYYTMETLVFYLKHRDVAWGEYVKLANTNSIPLVSRIDRQELTKYLFGESE